MNNDICPIKLQVRHFNDSHRGWIVGTFADGQTCCYGDFKTQRGAKSILTKCAKLFNLTKSKDGMSAS